MIATGKVERDAGERGSHFKTGKAGGARGGFAGVEDFAPEAAAGPIGVNEEGADFGGVDRGIEKIWFADGGAVAADEGFAMTPAAAADQHSGAGGACLGDQVGAISDELGVETEQRAERAIDLFGCVVVSLQAAHRGFNQCTQRGLVVVSGQAKGDWECGVFHRRFFAGFDVNLACNSKW